MENIEKDRQIFDRTAPLPIWWCFWIGGGIIFTCLEIIGNAVIGRFPLLLTALPAYPLIAIPLNAIIYLALTVFAAMIVGLLAELFRRILRLGYTVHLVTAAILLIGLAFYLGYGVVASDIDKVDPSQGLPDGYRPPLGLWWLGYCLASGIVLISTGYFTGFFRKDKRFISALMAAVGAIVIFNIVDHSLRPELARFWLLTIVSVAAVGLYFILNCFRISFRGVIAVIGLLAAGIIIIQGIYFSWSGHGYDCHLVLLIWDALPADRMNVYGYEEDNTPNLSAWRDRMVRFTQAYSPANYTFASHVSIFTGRYIREHHLYSGTLEESALYSSFPNLAESVSLRGYRPLLLTENPWLIPISDGFEVAISCPTRPQSTKYFLPFYRDTFLIRQLIDHAAFNYEGDFKWIVLRIEKRILTDWLLRARRDGPYFIFSNWMYFHSRYCPTVPEKIAHNKLPQRAYDDCIGFMDAYLHEWMNMFDQAGQLNDSMFLLTADHGDFLGEFGMYGHGKTLLEPVLNVPLLLFGENVNAEIIENPVPLVSLKPAIEALIPAEPEIPWNVSAFIDNLKNNRGMVVEGSFDFEGPDNSIRWFLAAWEGKKKYMQDAHKYIPGYSEGLDMDTFYFYYDLSVDPGEKNNLAPFRQDEVRRMRKIISKWENKLDPVLLPPPDEGEDDEYPPGLVEQLRALGYMR